MTIPSSTLSTPSAMVIRIAEFLLDAAVWLSSFETTDARWFVAVESASVAPSTRRVAGAVACGAL